MMRLQAGLREPAYEASVRNMLADGLLGEEELNIQGKDDKKIIKNCKEKKELKVIGKEEKRKRNNLSTKTDNKLVISTVQLISDVNDDGMVSLHRKLEIGRAHV